MGMDDFVWAKVCSGALYRSTGAKGEKVAAKTRF
jgi:hypothetical protein